MAGSRIVNTRARCSSGSASCRSYLGTARAERFCKRRDGGWLNLVVLPDRGRWLDDRDQGRSRRRDVRRRSGQPCAACSSRSSASGIRPPPDSSRTRGADRAGGASDRASGRRGPRPARRASSTRWWNGRCGRPRPRSRREARRPTRPRSGGGRPRRTRRRTAGGPGTGRSDGVGEADERRRMLGHGVDRPSGSDRRAVEAGRRTDRGRRRSRRARGEPPGRGRPAHERVEDGDVGGHAEAAPPGPSAGGAVRCRRDRHADDDRALRARQLAWPTGYAAAMAPDPPASPRCDPPRSGKVHHVALIVSSIEALARAVARRARPRARNGHGHPVRPGPDRVPRGGRVEDRARRADRRHDRGRAFPGQQGRGLPPRLLRGPEPRRDAPPPRDRRYRAHRHRTARAPRGRSRSSTRARATACSSSSSRRRAVRPGPRSGSDRAADRAVAGLRAFSENIRGSSPRRPGGRSYRPSPSSTRKSTFQSRNGCSTSRSITRPASISAVTISPRP